MSFLTDKKLEHERKAIAAGREGRYEDAFYHATEAARLGFDLAELSQGEMRRAYLADAKDWTELAGRLKGRKNAPGAVGVADSGAGAVGPQIPAGKDPDGDSGAAAEWLKRDRPKERFADVAGCDEVKRIVIDDVVNAAKYAEQYRTMNLDAGGGALMYGPPGNGKTLFARAVAGELDAAFFCVSGADIKDKYVGETEKNMRRLFEAAGKCEKAVVFIDEINALLGRRGREKVSAVDEFLVMTDGFEKRKNTLLLLGATNFPWMLDPAVFRRMKNLVYVGMPDPAAREEIFRLQFKGVPVEHELPFSDFAARADGYSGADVARVATAAKKAAMRRMIEQGADAPILLVEDVLTALASTYPTVSPSTIQQYRDWEREFFGPGYHGGACATGAGPSRPTGPAGASGPSAPAGSSDPGASDGASGGSSPFDPGDDLSGGNFRDDDLDE